MPSFFILFNPFFTFLYALKQPFFPKFYPLISTMTKNIKEASEYTSLPIKTLYEWASQRKIPSIKFGRRVLFDLQDIDQIMAAQKRDAQQCDKTVNKIVGGILKTNYNA